ncbi:CD151 antigen-like [Antedon mediterranea]|uniref:CD151 antigen-like n=1 Tax=Antedon mediterranea TaxID=105859 RepID=UPI003AF7965C
MANVVQPVRTQHNAAAKCCNLAIYLLNLVYALGSFVMAAFATWVIVENMSGDIALMFDSDTYVSAGFILIFGGLFVVVLAIYGCCSTWKQNKSCVFVYLIALSVMFVVEIIGGVTALSFYVQGTNDLETVMLNTLQFEYGIGGNENNQDDVTFAWNNVQEEWDCCGVFSNEEAGPIAYLHSQWWLDQPVLSRTKVPLSCCKEKDNGEPIDARHCQDPITDYSQVYKVGCYDAVKAHGDLYTIPLSVIGITHAFILFISVIFAYCFYRNMG